MTEFTPEELKKFQEARALLDQQLKYTNDDKDARAKSSDKKLNQLDVFIQAGKEKNKDPVWLKQHSENMSKRMTDYYKDPANREQARLNSIKAAEKIDYADVVKKREKNNWHEKNVARYDDPEFKARHAESVRKANIAKAKDPAWLKANREAQEKTRKVFVLKGIGEFKGKKAAEDKLTELGIQPSTMTMGKVPHLFYRKDLGPGKPTYETVFYTEFGIFNKRLRVYRRALELGLTKPYKNLGSWWTVFCKQNPEKRYSKHEEKSFRKFNNDPKS